MTILFLYLLLWQPETQLRMGESLRIEQHQDVFLQRPSSVRLGRQNYVVLDSKQNQFWVISPEGQVAKVFGGKGEAPGQIAGKIVSWFIQNDQIHAIHGGGHRLEIFQMDGTFVTSKKLSTHGTSLFPLGQNGWIAFTDNPKDAVVLKQNTKKTLSLIPSEAQKNLSEIRAAAFGSWLFLANTHGNTNTVYWGVVDLENAKLHRQGSFQTIRSSDPEKFPPLPPNAKLFAINLSGMGAGYDNNLYLTESGMQPLIHPSLGRTNVVRRFNQHGNRMVFRIYSGDINFTQLIPIREGWWLGTSATEGQITLFEAVPLHDKKAE